jgi:hypothetical protein
MKIVKKEIPAVHYEEITYDEVGETDGKYSVGDKIKAVIIGGIGEIIGIITKIVVVEYKSIHQIQVNNSWWVHPIEWYGNDEVTILEKVSNQLKSK